MNNLYVLFYHRREHGHEFFKDRESHEQQFNKQPQRLPVIENGSTETSAPCPANIASRERFLIEHSYNSLCADKPAHHNRHSNEVFSGNWLHRTLMQCTSIDIPLPSADYNNGIESDCCHSNCDGIDTILATTHLIDLQTPDENITKVVNPKNLSLSEPTLLPNSVTLPLGAKPLHSSANYNNDCAETANQEETAVIDFELESSPLSLNGFEMDLDSEIDSISSSPSRDGSDDDVIFITSSVTSLNVSIPLNKVSLPTRLLLKHSLITKSPAIILIKDTPQVIKNGQPFIEEAPAMSNDRSVKQQSETMQLRNRALPRNLFLFASRKGPPKMKEDEIDVVTLDSSFDNTPPRDEIATQSIVSNERKQESDGDMDWKSESSYEIESILNDHHTSVAVKRKAQSSSPSPCTPPAKVWNL